MAGNANSGRHRLPLSELARNGTLRMDRHGDRVDAPRPESKPKRPVGLPTDARKLWDQLMKLPWVGESDGETLRVLCETWHLLRTVTKQLLEDPVDKNARIAWQTYASEFNRLASQFGLTPATREKMRIPSNNGTDELDQIIRDREFEKKYLA